MLMRSTSVTLMIEYTILSLSNEENRGLPTFIGTKESPLTLQLSKIDFTLKDDVMLK